jgi:hypothetical protein
MLCTCIQNNMRNNRTPTCLFAGSSTCQTCGFLKFCPVGAFFEFQFWGFSALEPMTRYEEMDRCKNHKSFVLQTSLFILACLCYSDVAHILRCFFFGCSRACNVPSGVRKDKHVS